MKMFKRKNFMSLVLSLLLSLPFLHILVTCAYTIFNKNAFESWGGTLTLDTAFEYSIGQFITANEFGKLDFFSWFSGIFLDNTAHDLIYIHFINWYLNYALYVSISFLLFHILYFFIDFIRKLMDRGNELI